MQFQETSIPGAWLITPERMSDERGFFARTFCRREMEARGLNGVLAQCSISYNAQRGTLRGMHYQAAPHAECKLVRCTAGAIYDVILDLRADSPSYKRWYGVQLSAENRQALYIPAGVAHGFLTESAGAEVFYQISEYYHPECARGVRWNDPAFGIHWNGAVCVISSKDQSYSDFPL